MDFRGDLSQVYILKIELYNTSRSLAEICFTGEENVSVEFGLCRY